MADDTPDKPAAVQAGGTNGERWKLGNEFAPFHPDASHVSPDYRDGWNDCHRAALAVAQVAPSMAEVDAIVYALRQAGENDSTYAVVVESFRLAGSMKK